MKIIDRIYISIYTQVGLINCKTDLNVRRVKVTAWQSQKGKVAEPEPLLMCFKEVNRNFVVFFLLFISFWGSQLDHQFLMLSSPSLPRGWISRNDNCIGRLLLIALFRIWVKCLLGYCKVRMILVLWAVVTGV